MGRRHPRPDLGRPSLFADFDQASVEDIEPQRIRLLSTLESQRGVRSRARAGRLQMGRNRAWLTRVLMVVMGLGMLVMLLSFIQLIRRPPPSVEVTQAIATDTTVPRPASQVASVHGTADLTAPVEAAEIIDMSPPAAGSARGAVLALPQHASPGSIDVSAAGMASSNSAPAAPLVSQSAPPSAHAMTSVDAPRPTVASATGPERSGRKAAHLGERGRNTQPEAGASHEDVALVEAMLAHAGPRQAPPSPTAALQRCGAGNAPEVAVCRARICVQHPSLPACHAP
jgi:hypothetical protein